jgi:hypothetical protein
VRGSDSHLFSDSQKKLFAKAKRYALYPVACAATASAHTKSTQKRRSGCCVAPRSASAARSVFCPARTTQAMSVSWCSSTSPFAGTGTGQGLLCRRRSHPSHPTIGIHQKNVQGASKKKRTKKKEPCEKRPTDFPPLFFLGPPFRRYARRLCGHATAYGRAPAAGCGVFVYEPVPSGDTQNFFVCVCFSPTAFLFPPKIKLSSQRVLQLLPYKASPIRTSTYTTSPLSLPIFALCLGYTICCF